MTRAVREKFVVQASRLYTEALLLHTENPFVVRPSRLHRAGETPAPQTDGMAALQYS